MSDPKVSVTFEDVVQRYHGKVFQMICRYVDDHDAACDLTQDTFVRAFAAWSEFRGEAQVYTWLYRIALNGCHNHQKKLRRQRQAESFSLDSPVEMGDFATPIPSQIADKWPLPEQLLETRELRARLHGALQQMPDSYRTVIILRDIEGASYQEMAQIIGCSLPTIKSRLFRARNELRRLLEPYVVGETAASR